LLVQGREAATIGVGENLPPVDLNLCSPRFSQTVGEEEAEKLTFNILTQPKNLFKPNNTPTLIVFIYNTFILKERRDALLE
jgi:hypothetical protein